MTTDTTLTPERRREIREAIAREIESALVLGVFRDAADATTHAALSYLGEVVDSLTRTLREEPHA